MLTWLSMHLLLANLLIWRLIKYYSQMIHVNSFIIMKEIWRSKYRIWLPKIYLIMSWSCSWIKCMKALWRILTCKSNSKTISSIGWLGLILVGERSIWLCQQVIVALKLKLRKKGILDYTFKTCFCEYKSKLKHNFYNY